MAPRSSSPAGATSCTETGLSDARHKRYRVRQGRQVRRRHLRRRGRRPAVVAGLQVAGHRRDLRHRRRRRLGSRAQVGRDLVGRDGKAGAGMDPYRRRASDHSRSHLERRRGVRRHSANGRRDGPLRSGGSEAVACHQDARPLRHVSARRSYRGGLLGQSDPLRGKQVARDRQGPQLMVGSPVLGRTTSVRHGRPSGRPEHTPAAQRSHPTTTAQLRPGSKLRAGGTLHRPGR
jgi:hypothetical protein